MLIKTKVIALVKSSGFTQYINIIYYYYNIFFIKSFKYMYNAFIFVAIFDAFKTSKLERWFRSKPS